MKKKVKVEPGAVLLLGFLLYSFTFDELAALSIAVLTHEAGHLAALTIAGSLPCGIRFSFTGPVILCSNPDSGRKRMLAAFSGPAAGVLLWFLLRLLWPLCADISLLLSMINLLPVLPLDGGRALAAFSERCSRLLPVFGFVIPIAMMLFGLFSIHHGVKGFGALLFGAWLLLLSCQESQIDVK